MRTAVFSGLVLVALSAQGQTPSLIYDEPTGEVTFNDVVDLVGLRINSTSGIMGGDPLNLGGATDGNFGVINPMFPWFIEWGNLLGMTFESERAGGILPADSWEQVEADLQFLYRTSAEPGVDRVGLICNGFCIPEPSVAVLIMVLGSCLATRRVRSMALLAALVCLTSADKAQAATWEVKAFDGLFTALMELDESHPDFTPGNALIHGEGLTGNLDDGTGVEFPGPLFGAITILGPDPAEPAGSGFGWLDGENDWKEVSMLKVAPDSDGVEVSIIIIPGGTHIPPGAVASFRTRYSDFFDANVYGPDDAFGVLDIGTVRRIDIIPEPSSLVLAVLCTVAAVGVRRNPIAAR